MKRVLIFFLVSMALLACNPAKRYIRIDGYAQGGTYCVKLNMEGVSVPADEIRDSVEATESITQLRKQIDELDNQLMDILAKRMRVCREIGHYKKEHNMTVLQAVRYNEILSKRGVQGSLCGMSPDFVAKVFESIHEESVHQQIEIINK